MFINTPINYDCQSFKRLVLPKRVVPTGFVFVWADKENIPAILDVFEEKNFFTWRTWCGCRPTTRTRP